MRIIAGKHRGRRLFVPPGRDIRPTADRTREALFNVLAHRRAAGLNGLRVLDAFCGTGALGLVALSRGAAHAVFMDVDRSALDALRRNLATLGEAPAATVVPADATRPPTPAGPACTLVLLDPPYRSGLAAPALAALAAAGWVAADAAVVVELGRREGFEPPPGFSVADERSYGAAKVLFLSPLPGAPAASPA